MFSKLGDVKASSQTAILKQENGLMPHGMQQNNLHSKGGLHGKWK